MESNLSRTLTDELAFAEAPTIGVEENLSTAARVKKPEPRLYRVIWRWHFYAGLIVLPVIVTAALTGGLYVFREELENKFNAPMLLVEPKAERVSYATQLANAIATAANDAHINGMSVSGDPTLATVFTFHGKDDRYQYVYVNQHTGEVQGNRFYGDSFFDIVLKIHRNLFVGTIGRVIVELATSWGIILVVTGLYLWWPRGRDKVLGVWLPRLRGKSYLVWRDWHVVPGFYIALFAALIMATGLFFTTLFARGYQLMAYVTKSYPASYVTPPKSAKQEGGQQLPLDEALAIAARAQPEKEMYVGFPHDAEDSFSVFAGSYESPSTLSQLYLDQYSGKVLDVIRWQQLSAVAKVQLSAYPIHIGSIYGLPTKILAVLACLLIVVMSVTGAAMWWIRRPKGKTGFPLNTKEFKPAKWLIAVICFLGVLMPAAGISMLLIVLGDWLLQLWRRRIPVTLN